MKTEQDCIIGWKQDTTSVEFYLGNNTQIIDLDPIEEDMLYDLLTTLRKHRETYGNKHYGCKIRKVDY